MEHLIDGEMESGERCVSIAKELLQFANTNKHRTLNILRSPNHSRLATERSK
jgi:hypothetical protein